MAANFLMIENEDGDLVEVPSTYVVCPTCEGNGKVENPAFANGFTAIEFDRAFPEEEDKQRYLAGEYDVCCPQCSGLRVVKQVDETRELSERQKAAVAHQANTRRYDAMLSAEVDAERRMGC